MDSELNPDLQRKWLAALRSGEYKQGTTYLNNKGAFCCLGVLCEVSDAIKEPKDGVISYHMKGDSVGIHFSAPPKEIGVQVGLEYKVTPIMTGNVTSGTLQGVLIHFNDTQKYSFERIANELEHIWKELSIHPDQLEAQHG